MPEGGQFKIEVNQMEGYAFQVKFDWPEAAELRLDEPAPLGEQSGPNASRLVAAAVANCLSASLMFCLFRNEPPRGGIRAEVTGHIARNEQKRLRVSGYQVKLVVGQEVEESVKLKRCADLFEDFCVVTSSIRQGIAVDVSVETEDGEVLMG